MLAKAVDQLPGQPLLYEPKWDGLRCIVFRDGDTVTLTSPNSRPFNRYFPDLLQPLLAHLPQRSVIDGEIVMPTSRGLNSLALQMRLHPAESRVALLAAESPASFVAFDVLALNDTDFRPIPLSERRRKLELALENSAPPIYRTPTSRDKTQGLA